MAAIEAVLDASVLLACWLPETAERKSYAERVLQAGRDGTVFHAPFVFEAEIAAGLARAMRSRVIDLDAVTAALDVMESVGVVVHFYPYTARILMDLAVKHQLQVSDSLYFHLAQSYALPLATLDGGLQTAAESYAVALFEP